MEWTTRDSAGITIVENHNPAWADTPPWTVDTEVAFQIGAVDGAAAEIFGRIVGLARRSDGVVVVAEGESNQLRFFDSMGQHIMTVGRAGDGPAEFRGLYRIRASGTTVYALDAIRRRVVEVNQFGEVATALTMPRGAMTLPVDIAPDGSLYFFAPVIPPEGFGPGIMNVPWYKLRGGTQTVDTIGPIPGGFVATDQARNSIPIFVRPQPVSAVAEGGVWHSPSSMFEITLSDDLGSTQMIVRKPSSRYALSADERESLVSWHKGVLAQVAAMGASAPSAIILDTLPAIKAMLTDQAGNLWVQGYAPLSSLDAGEWPTPSPPGDSDWTVIDPRGRWLGTVAMPSRFTPYEIGADTLLGVWEDSLGVQYVRLYRLLK